MTAPSTPFAARIPADAAAVPPLLDALEAWLAGTGLPREACLDLVLAVDEAVANAILHGYGGGPGEIAVAGAVADGTVELRVEDRAPPFDPLGVPPPALESEIGERSVGGLGIHLIRSLADRVEYRREGDRNILVITRAGGR